MANCCVHICEVEGRGRKDPQGKNTMGTTSDFQTQEEIRGKDNAEKELVQKDVKEQRRGGKDPIQALFLFVGTQ